MSKNKKPTLMEMKTVVTNALIEISRLNNHVSGLDAAFSGYVEFKGDTDNYKTWMNKKLEEINAARSTESGDSTGTTGVVQTGEQASSEQNKEIKV